MIMQTEAEPLQENPRLSTVGDDLQCGLGVVTDLERSLERLDVVLLTGRPHAIADAAKAMELSCSAAEPAFQRVALALETLGVARLGDAAQQLRRSDETAAAATADALRRALKRFARRNDACHRRAQGMSRGLSASLRTLQALGMAGSGRLIAEA
jgi:hypothetical protein